MKFVIEIDCSNPNAFGQDGDACKAALGGILKHFAADLIGGRKDLDVGILWDSNGYQVGGYALLEGNTPLDLCKELAYMKTASEMDIEEENDVGETMSGDDACATLSDSIESARAITEAFDPR